MKKLIERCIESARAAARLLALAGMLVFFLHCAELLADPDSSKPPWKKNDSTDTLPKAKKYSSPRDHLINVEDSEIAKITDGEPLETGNETLIKVLFRLPKFGLDNIQRYADQTGDVKLADVLADPKSHRVKMFRLSGRVTSLKVHELPPEVAQYIEFKTYYEVGLKVADGSIPVTIHTRNIPAAWKKQEELDERASCVGLFIAAGEKSDEVAPLNFAALRIGWHPDRERPEANIFASHVLLGDLGMDVGLFDVVRLRNRKAIGALDSECFYQLLSAMGRAKAADLAKRTKGDFEIGPLLIDPTRQHGKLMVVEGNARRVTRIAVDRPYTRDRLGIDHYFEVDIFIPLGNQVVKLGKDDNAPVFRNNYPVTVCVRSLPEGLDESDNVNELVRIPCFYFKLWAYKSEFIRQQGAKGQLSPLLVGIEPEIVEYQPIATPIIGLIAVVVIVLAMGGIWAGLWFYGRADKKFEKETLNRQFEVEKGKSLNHLELDVKDGPDFSDLE